MKELDEVILAQHAVAICVNLLEHRRPLLCREGEVRTGEKLRHLLQEGDELGLGHLAAGRARPDRCEEVIVGHAVLRDVVLQRLDGHPRHARHDEPLPALDGQRRRLLGHLLNVGLQALHRIPGLVQEHFRHELLLVLAGDGLGLRRLDLQGVDPGDKLGEVLRVALRLLILPALALPLGQKPFGQIDLLLRLPLRLPELLAQLMGDFGGDLVGAALLGGDVGRRVGHLLHRLLGLVHLRGRLLLVHRSLPALGVLDKGREPLRGLRALLRQLLQLLAAALGHDLEELLHLIVLLHHEGPGLVDASRHRLGGGLAICDGLDGLIQRKRLDTLKVRHLGLRCLLEQLVHRVKFLPRLGEDGVAHQPLALLPGRLLHLVHLALGHPRPVQQRHERVLRGACNVGLRALQRIHYLGHLGLHGIHRGVHGPHVVVRRPLVAEGRRKDLGLLHLGLEGGHGLLGLLNHLLGPPQLLALDGVLPLPRDLLGHRIQLRLKPLHLGLVGWQLDCLALLHLRHEDLPGVHARDRRGLLRLEGLLCCGPQAAHLQVFGLRRGALAQGRGSLASALQLRLGVLDLEGDLSKPQSRLPQARLLRELRELLADLFEPSLQLGQVLGRLDANNLREAFDDHLLRLKERPGLGDSGFSDRGRRLARGNRRLALFHGNVLHSLEEGALSLGGLQERVLCSLCQHPGFLENRLGLQALHLASELHLEVLELLLRLLAPVEHEAQLRLQGALRRLKPLFHELHRGDGGGHRRRDGGFRSGDLVGRGLGALEDADHLLHLELGVTDFLGDLGDDLLALQLLFEVLPHAHVGRYALLDLVQLLL
mmetsp:Transcript_66904/g.193342  ORF Transcript_66904/g.193342 Transcript_66904/m.193342 type:complete len:824 (-) Transcript_66904:1434-3905(-)